MSIIDQLFFKNSKTLLFLQTILIFNAQTCSISWTASHLPPWIYKGDTGEKGDTDESSVKELANIRQRNFRARIISNYDAENAKAMKEMETSQVIGTLDIINSELQVKYCICPLIQIQSIVKYIWIQIWI